MYLLFAMTERLENLRRARWLHGGAPELCRSAALGRRAVCKNGMVLLTLRGIWIAHHRKYCYGETTLLGTVLLKAVVGFSVIERAMATSRSHAAGGGVDTRF